MPDDRSSKRFPRIQSDDARATQPRARTPVHGVPAFVDPELTPPPQSATEAIAALWHERGNGERIERLEGVISDLSKSVHAWAAEAVRQGEQIVGLKSSIGSVVPFTESLREITAHMSARMATFFDHEWPRLERTLEDLDDRLRRIEHGIERLETSDQALSVRLSAVETRSHDVERRVQAIERAGHEGALITATEANQRRRWFTAARAAFGIASAGLGWLASRLFG